MEHQPEQKYKVGEVVFQKASPEEQLVVRRYISRIYYCKFQHHPDRKELALFEREIISEAI